MHQKELSSETSVEEVADQRHDLVGFVLRNEMAGDEGRARTV
jgi:hypothetical protein